MGDGGLVSPGSGAWPVQLTRLFGWDVEAAELCRLVENERLVTLVGAPGCGKTRLAVEVGARVGLRFGGGVRLVELGPIGDPGLIAHAVGVALGVVEQPGRPMQDVLVDALDRADSVLVLLDNCEHMVDAAAVLTQRLVTACPSVSVLTTSRAALGVPGEHAWRVPSSVWPMRSSCSRIERGRQRARVSTRPTAPSSRRSAANWAASHWRSSSLRRGPGSCRPIRSSIG